MLTIANQDYFYLYEFARFLFCLPFCFQVLFLLSFCLKNGPCK